MVKHIVFLLCTIVCPQYTYAGDIYTIKSGAWTGTGFAISNGIVTNAHVCRGAKEVLVKGYDFEVKKIVLKIDVIYDLCLIEGLQGKNFSLASYSWLGDIITIKNRFLKEGKGKIINKILVNIEGIERILQDTTVKGAPGDSGSPVLNSKEELVGVVAAIRDDNLLSIIPLNIVKDFLQ